MDCDRCGCYVCRNGVRLIRKLNTIIRAVTLCTVLLALTSCSALTSLSKAALGGTQGVTAQVGQSNESNKLKAEVSTETEQTTEITSESVQIFNENISLTFLILLILGWLLPSPSEIGRSIMRSIKCLRSSL